MVSTNQPFQGVKYDVSKGSHGRAIVVEDLTGWGVKYVRIQWVDLTNNIRFRVLPLAYFHKILQTPRPGTSLTKAVLGIVFITVVDGFSPTGEYVYAVDLSTLRLCPYAPGHASVMGWFEEKEPVAGVEGHRSVEVDLCPRTILRRVVEKAEQRCNTQFLIGFETEFILLKKTSPIEAGNSHGWCVASALPTGSAEAQILEEIVDALQARGSDVEVQMYHAEAAPGQYEVVTGPLPPLQAVDALIHTRETIFNIASKHGMRATLAPRVFMDNCGSAAHVHISVHPSSGASPAHLPLSTNSVLTPLESSFLSGVLAHLSSIALLALPTEPSYKRMADGVWSGGTYVCWGRDNREAPLRLCNASSPTSRNFELKTLDGTANPYLAIAAVLGAGLDGIEHGRELKIKECSGEKSAALLGSAGRAELGITERLPLSWKEARVNFEKSELVDEFFGAEFKTKFLAANKTLQEQMSFGLMDDEELKLFVETF
ncbi:Protein fluG [Psilocybe cubensis]|uniref:Protein fluG n=2 Tax=Psilocybe cubensis TaxID=181762 RepID=A0ACB8GPT9_PSICU|nr:Protein fluG [Psilocybe cubensis]KAH9477666.1 Protein fluG [Psilocybe cubensis]